ncbi:hypothetical protein [Sporosarcina sp. FSL W7-1283]|uniref:hypothetical protein n=1 Tax=Sporosarcina sp. FSL W7-1283 TaxID=2921560 RepID=UPI0030FB0916
MGHIVEIARSNDFIVKNLHNFKEGLRGFRGEFGEFQFDYHGLKRRSKNAYVNVSSSHFEQWLENELEQEMDTLEYIQKHIKEGEECVIHLISYEHPMDMSITKYNITDISIKEYTILE